MDIKLTPEQVEEFLGDEYINIEIGDYRLYMEIEPGCGGRMWYFEAVKSKNGRTEQGYAFDITELEKLQPKRPTDPSYYHNDPLCPNCQTYLIYNFEHCPKCGQKIDWSEE